MAWYAASTDVRLAKLMSIPLPQLPDSKIADVSQHISTLGSGFMLTQSLSAVMCLELHL